MLLFSYTLLTTVIAVEPNVACHKSQTHCIAVILLSVWHVSNQVTLPFNNGSLFVQLYTQYLDLNIPNLLQGIGWSYCSQFPWFHCFATTKKVGIILDANSPWCDTIGPILLFGGEAFSHSFCMFCLLMVWCSGWGVDLTIPYANWYSVFSYRKTNRCTYWNSLHVPNSMRTI